MARSLWKGPFVDRYLLKKLKTKDQELVGPGNNNKASSNNNNKEFKTIQSIEAQKSSLKNGNPIRVWSRRSFILPEFIDQSFEIYNGKQFILFKVNEDMIGHKFGEFASTRKKTIHKKKNQK